MPYIPAANRPAIDVRVDAVAEAIADAMIAQNHTAELSTHYRRAFLEIADFIAATEAGSAVQPKSKAQELAATVLEVARSYNQIGAWAGELNYAITMLIQMVPYKMYQKKAWAEPLRYWIHSQTVGALTRTAYDLHTRTSDDYVGNGLTGVFEDIKDELKRRVNTAYEAAQINKSGDCFDWVPFRTQLVPFTAGGAEGFIEVMLPHRKLS